MPSIPVDVLRAFVAVVEARGFTRAAEELGRSQPTISLQVKRLEELVEAPLFDKAARFELTPVGAVCFDYGKRLLRLHDDMLDEASRCKAPDAMLRVGVASEFAARLAPSLGRLRRDETIASGFSSGHRHVPFPCGSLQTEFARPCVRGRRRVRSARGRALACAAALVRRRRRPRWRRLRCLSRSRRRDPPSMRPRSRLCEPKDASSSSCA